MPGKLAHGTRLYMGDGADPEVFTEIPNCGDFDLDPPEPEEVDVTDHTSTAREHLDGLGGDGQCTTELHYDPSIAIHDDVLDKHGVSDPTNFKLRLPSDVVFLFAATVRYQLRFPVGGAQTAPLTLRISGPLARDTWT